MRTTKFFLLLSLATCEANALTGLSPTFYHSGINTNQLTGGRMASVIMGSVPSQTLLLAIAVAEAGGVYKGFNAGETWIGSALDNGASGDIGLGFAGTGVNIFSHMAISPTGSLLVLAGTGNFFFWYGPGGNSPIWRSDATSGGAVETSEKCHTTTQLRLPS